MTSRLTKMRLVAWAMITGAGLWAMGSSFGQLAADPAGADLPAMNSGVETSAAEASARSLAAHDMAGATWNWQQSFSGKNELLESLHVAAAAYRDAKDDDAKAAAQKKLAELLSKFFDEDMARRKTEVTKVEERLAKLRELLERRQAKKQEIVELQTKVVINEADGLGFYESPLTELRGQYMNLIQQPGYSGGSGRSGSSDATPLFPIQSESGIPAPAADPSSDPFGAPTPSSDSAAPLH